MQLHIKKAFEVITNFLPTNYADTAFAKCSSLKIETTKENIVQIKNKRGQKNLEYLKIVEVLVDIALENKKNLKKLETKINN